MRRKTLSVLKKVFTTLFLLVYSFTPSVQAIEDVASWDDSQDILEEGISDPSWIADGSTYTTSDVVAVGKTYIFPGNEDVSVTFTKLPEDTSKLSIKEITLTEEEIEATGAVSDKAYDITTDMADGTFEYDLTLPSSVDNANVVYAETRDDIADNNVQEVENTIVDNGDTLKIENLDHFTIYIVVPDNTDSSNSVTNPNNGRNSDNNYAVFDNKDDYVVYSFPDISIPSGSIIDGIEVLVEGKTGGRDLDISLWNQSNTNPDNYTTTKTANLNSTEATVTVGGSTEKWGKTWTVDDFNSSFKIRVDANSGGDSASLDSIQVKVHYTEPETPLTPPTLENNPSDDYALTSVTAVWTAITGGSGYEGINTNEIRWGTPASSQKSGLKFTNSGAQSFNEGDTFYLGMLTHMNWPTYAGTAANGATLQITLDFDRPDIEDVVLTYDFDVEETSNQAGSCPAYQESGTPCDDKITFPSSYGTETFTIDDVIYTLVIDGFVDAYPSGTAVTAFITEEEKDNSAFLVGHLSSVLVERPDIRITKKTNGEDITSSANAENLYVGSTVTWEYVIQNSGNTALTNISVTDNPSEIITCPSTTLASGATMTCTATGTVQEGLFSNTATVVGTYSSGTVTASDTSYYNGIQKSHLIVQKITLPAGDSTDFDITLSTSDGEIYENVNGIVNDSTDYDYTVSAGTYSVSEDAESGWGQTSNTCTNVEVGVGETVYCTITNSKLPVLIVEKVLIGDSISLDTFSFAVDGGSSNQFEADGSNDIFVVPDSNYVITEVNPSNIYNVSYSDGCSGNLTYGETATCTITNTKYASLTIVKDANPDSSQDFSFTTSGTGLSAFSLDDDTDGTLSNTKTFNNLLPGTYSVTESAVSGWDLTNVVCSDGSSNTAINLSAGENVTCTFTNTMRGAIGGHKYNDADGNILTTGDRTGVAGWTIELWQNDVKLNTTTTAGVNGTYGFSNLVSGTYQLRESLQIGWYTLYPASYDDYITVTLLPGQNNFGNDFINVQYASVTVYKNIDSDGNGSVDILGSRDWKWDIDGSGNYSTGTIISRFTPGTYTFSEEQVDGYHVTSLVCNNGVDGVDNNYGAVESQSISVSSGQNLVCTFTNTRDTGTLRVVKELTNDNGGTLNEEDFSFKVNGGNDTYFDTDGINEITLPTGTYTVVENTANGYATTHSNCTNVKVTKGGVTTCTITNDDIAPALTLVKSVENNNGGNAVSADWTVTATGPTTISGNGTVTSDSTFDAGTYTLSESGSVTGYTASNWSCVKNGNPAVEGNTITLGLGDTAVCTITNDDIAPTVTLTKAVSNDDGGNAGVNDFDLTIGGTSVISGQTLSVSANTPIEIDEAGLTGYSFVSITGDDKCPSVLGGTVTLDEGENISCTITNDDIAPRLTVIKHVVNDSDGVLDAEDFTMNISGTNVSDDSFAGSETGTTVTLDAGSYSVSEIYNISDYTQSLSSDCSGSIGIGESKTCTITNSDIDHLPAIEVTKTADKSSVKETGEDVLFTFTVKNNSSEAVKITNLTDSDFGTLSGDSDCQVNTILASGSTCEFTKTVFISGDASGTNHENIFTAIAEDDEGNPASDSDNEIISFTDVEPTVELVKTVDIESLDEPGGVFTYTLGITNESLESVTISDITDTNAMSAGCLALIGTSLAAGASTSCTYTVTHTEAGSYSNTATVRAVDNDGSVASDQDTETVSVVDVKPAIEVTKVANDTSIPETGQDVIFTFTVKNNSVEKVTLTSLEDSVFGTLAGDGDCHVGTELISGDSCSFTLSRNISGEFGYDHKNTFTAKAEDNENNIAEDSDTETVEFTDVLPAVDITKTVDLNTLPEPGGIFTFTLTIKNLSLESEKIVAMSDNYPFSTDCINLAGRDLLPGEEVSCSYNVSQIEAGIYDNTADVTVQDNEGNYAYDSDSAEISVTDVKPAIEVTKVVNDTSIPETGQNVTFTFTVKNNSVESVTISSLGDTTFGPMSGDSDCQIGTVLSVGGSCDFEYTEFISGDYGNDHSNTFTAGARDNENNESVDSDTETVEFTNVDPDISVTKTPSVSSIPETGADVTFTYVVTNNTNEEVWITSLTDDKLSGLDGDSDCQIGTELSAYGSCTFDETMYISGTAPEVHTNTFTAVVEDDEEHTDTADTTASVSLTYVPTLKLVKNVTNSYNGSAEAGDWTLTASGDRYGFSNSGDEGIFHVVTPGQEYILSETFVNGYESLGWVCDGGTLVGNIITLEEEDDVTCTVTNRDLPGTIVVSKEVVDNEDYSAKSETDFTVSLLLDGEIVNTGDIRDGETSDNAEFINLDAGVYSVEELLEDGYINEGCRVMTDEIFTRLSTLLDLEDGEFVLGNGETLYVVCTNEVVDPVLEIEKENNTAGIDRKAGDNVVYTITVTAPEVEEDGGDYVIKDVELRDILPAGFSFVSGSWTATKNGLAISLTEPVYDSIFALWNLGDMEEGDVIILSYTGNISSTQDAGLYKDYAWVRGTSLSGSTVLGNKDTGIFVGTQVNVVENGIEEGEVLGASTVVTLPDTGANTILTLGIVLTMVLGFLMIFFKSKKKGYLLSLVVVGILGLSFTSVSAQTVDKFLADIEEPASPVNTQDFKIGFVVADTLGDDITVQCTEKTYGVFNTYTGVNAGDCIVNSSVVPVDGTYIFYISATNSVETVYSDEVTVIADFVKPSAILDYVKTESGCSNVLTFTTANDGQTSKVQIFRSTDSSFTANSSNMVAQLSAAPNQNVVYTDAIASCNTTYYYAVRALDIAGNVSPFVSDNVVVTVKAEKTEETTNTVVNDNQGEVEGEETSATDEEAGNTNEEENSTDTDNNGEVKGETDENTSEWTWWQYTLLGAGIIAVVYVIYLYVKTKRGQGSF